MSNREEVLKETWNHLRRRICQAHNSKRDESVILEALDKEFVKLGRRLLKLQVSKSSYQILKVDPTYITRGHISLRSNDGHCINIYEKDWELFNEWVNFPAEEKMIHYKTTVKIGDRGYTTRTIFPKEPRVMSRHEIYEQSKKNLEGEGWDD